MIPKVGDKIKVLDLPSYRKECKPKTPCEGTVKSVFQFTFLADIDGKVFEFYDDDSYEIVKT